MRWTLFFFWHGVKVKKEKKFSKLQSYHPGKMWKLFCNIFYLLEMLISERKKILAFYALIVKGPILRIKIKNVITKYKRNFVSEVTTKIWTYENYKKFFYFLNYLKFAIGFAFFLRGGYMKKKIFFKVTKKFFYQPGRIIYLKRSIQS